MRSHRSDEQQSEQPGYIVCIASRGRQGRAAPGVHGLHVYGDRLQGRQTYHAAVASPFELQQAEAPIEGCNCRGEGWPRARDPRYAAIRRRCKACSVTLGRSTDNPERRVSLPPAATQDPRVLARRRCLTCSLSRIRAARPSATCASTDSRAHSRRTTTSAPTCSSSTRCGQCSQRATTSPLRSSSSSHSWVARSAKLPLCAALPCAPRHSNHLFRAVADA